MAAPVESIRARLDDIGAAADSSGVKVPGFVRPPGRSRTVWIANAACLPVLLILLLRVHQHNEKVSCVKAFKRAGITARLDLLQSRGLPAFFNTPYFQYLFAKERVIAELYAEHDVALLISSDAAKSTPVNL
jgi:hypothetical protein